MNTQSRIVAAVAVALVGGGGFAMLRTSGGGGASQAALVAPETDERVRHADPGASREAHERALPPDTAVAAAEGLEVAPETQDAVDREVSESLVRPLIDAIRGEFASDEARRGAMLAALRASGDTAEAWTFEARSAFAGFRHGMRDIHGVAVDSVRSRCFRAGCEATVVFDDEGAYRAAAQAFRELSDAGNQHGGRVQTPAVQRADGRFEGSWIVLRPG